MTQKFKILIGLFTPILITLLAFYLFHYYFGVNPKYSGLCVELTLLITSILLIYVFTKLKIMCFCISKIELKVFFKIAIISYVTAFLLQFISGLTYIIFLRTISEKLDKLMFFQIIFMLLISPISYELMFRGFLLNMIDSLKEYKIKIYKEIYLTYSVILSGLVSGGVLFIYFTFHNHLIVLILTAISTMIMGIIAGYFQEKHNNFTAAAIVNYSNTLVSMTGVIISIIIN